MIMAGMIWFKNFAISNSNFVAPHKTLDPINAPIDQYAENFRAIEDHFDRTSIPSTPREPTTVTSLATINSFVRNCHVITLSHALQTQFTEQQKLDEQKVQENRRDSARYRRDDVVLKTTPFGSTGLVSYQSVWILCSCLQLATNILSTLSMASRSLT